ncbi:hypothetical protein [Alkalinema sp. FACHB-956]|uniref:hypothetical protein n=1 Tax=Alkalinema sp. FACHB-956 TaxID=2692768 RepID=UPI001689F990|nr:hypothetical protein [Alkalinema sp. FACHB-956]MBD2326666.1 hypothetical protein [Alkalinema sp. FACHB-956]
MLLNVLPQVPPLLRCAIVPLGLGLSSLIAFSNPAQAQAMFEDATLNPGFKATELRGLSGGNTPLKSIAGRSETATGSCLGYTDSDPDHTLKLNTPFSYLRLQVNSNVDTTIVVRGTGGTWCNDDFNDRNAGIEGEWQPGDYRVWIGNHSRNQTAPYTLKVTTQR